MREGFEMEKKLNFVKDGMTKLPPGFRFQPTDDELVFQYLKSKVFACPLPASIIPEINVCSYDPWDLPGDLEQEKYFFCNKEAKYRNGNRTNRATSSGCWKATGVDKKITSSERSNQMFGMKKTLVFYIRKPNFPNGSSTKTEWIMHEYRLVVAESAACSIFLSKNNSTSMQSSMIQKEDWVICRVFQRKTSTRTNDNVIIPRCEDYNRDRDSSRTLSSLSCSCSSGITEVSSYEESDNEENNYK